MKQELKDKFIELYRNLDPIQLKEHGRTPEEIETVIDGINVKWNYLEYKHKVEVSLEKAEEWSLDRGTMPLSLDRRLSLWENGDL